MQTMSDWYIPEDVFGQDGRQVFVDAQFDIDKHKEITREHWVSADKRTFCMNKACRRKFSLIDRQHHCRKCGEVFCNECVRYKRKLSYLAKPDPEGKPYKVCQACFIDGKDTDVPTRNLTGEFKSLKIRVRNNRSAEQRGSKSFAQSWRDKLDIVKECQRLKCGFQKSVGSSEMKRTLQEMKTVIKTPDWQKSSTWLQENMATKCQNCTQGFGLLRTKLNCKLCGQALCKSCCKRELLVYIPDETDLNENTNSREPEVAIIKIIGSPEVEPEISLLLHVCDTCRLFMVDVQVSRTEKSLNSSVEVVEEDVISKLRVFDGPLRTLQEKIDLQLSKYQDIVESLDNGTKKTGDGSNMKILAKAQEDLLDHFSTIVLKIQTLKKLQSLATTNTQKILLRHYLKAKSEFYVDNVYMFRCLKRILSEAAPAEVLQFIQKIVDKNTIVSAQVYVRQLIMESLHLCQKYSLRERIPVLLNPLDEAIEEEASQCLQSQGEQWDQHESDMMELIKTQMKNHRLIRPSKRQLAANQAKHAADILLKRTNDILEQVHVQLNMKSMNRSFRKTKVELEKTKEEALKLGVSDLLTSK